jgi:alpha-tubulin suppressor-like RCC1 family protein
MRALRCKDWVETMTPRAITSAALTLFGLAGLALAAWAPVAQAQTAPRVTTWSFTAAGKMTAVAAIDGLAGSRPAGTVTWKDGNTALGSAGVEPAAASAGSGTIAAGASHTCVIAANTGVKCWGKNDEGQLGNGTTTDSATPVAVKTGSADLTGVLAIAAGFKHTCALTASGVKCWGLNKTKQLGDDTTERRTTPVDVKFGAGTAPKIVDIASGGGHTCALTAAMTVKCWGYAGPGKDAQGMHIDKGNAPSDVALAGGATPLGSIVQIAAGNRHTCALSVDGAAYCWGINSRAEFGNGANDNTFVEKADKAGLVNRTSDKSYLANVVAIAAGSRQTCALTRAGSVACWGANNGPFGGGFDASRDAPIKDVFGSGLGNDYPLADKLIDWPSAPSPLDSNDVVVGLAAGRGNYLSDSGSPSGFHICALTIRGGVRCTGDNRKGQAGSAKAQMVDNAVAIAAGGEHTCAIASDGKVMCWGNNDAKQLGVASPASSSSPVAVVGVSAVLRVRALLEVARSSPPAALQATFAAAQ